MLCMLLAALLSRNIESLRCLSILLVLYLFSFSFSFRLCHTVENVQVPASLFAVYQQCMLKSFVRLWQSVMVSFYRGGNLGSRLYRGFQLSSSGSTQHYFGFIAFRRFAPFVETSAYFDSLIGGRDGPFIWSNECRNILASCPLIMDITFSSSHCYSEYLIFG